MQKIDLIMRKVAGFLGLLLLVSCSQGLQEKRLLVLYDVAKSNIEKDVQKLISVGTAYDIKVDTTSNLSILKEDTLRFYSSVIFLDVEGEVMDYKQQTDLERYIQAGGGVVGINTDIAPKYQWPWHNRLISAIENQSHDRMMVAHASTSESKSYPQGSFTFDGGRVTFISSLADVSDESLANILSFSIHNNSLDYEQVRSPRVPEDNRFTRIVLDDDLNEPIELDVMPDGKVIYIERRGNVKLYNPETRQVKLLTKFDVCTEGNYEDGMLGIAVDPKFHSNRRIYIYYSTTCEDSLQRLSRFYMAGDSLILASEKPILDVPVQRETCCHSGGAIQFGPDGLLYLSTGDNTSSKESNGYTPIDERSGRAPFDAQKSSGNTHDLRGKILRIRINEDGSAGAVPYSIPGGNLFPKDGSKGRPEIYVMGVRNPFRFSVDWKTGWLYWGDVGPDVGKDGIQGPQSYDEWNQAREPGFYGWPYFVADNKAYPDWDFATDTPGDFFDPEHPVNDSPNNYGSQELPPANPAMIWYPYGESEQWPILGTGSRSAMGGPVYYADRYKHSNVKFPSYYDGKLFIYEWVRSWIKVVSFDEEGRPVKIEPFLSDMPLSKPIDMEFGPDGAMYILEYGANYFADNDEARLVKIEYAEGNRKPVAEIVASQRAGASPFTVEFSALGSYDYDTDDALSYAWKFTSEDVQSEEAEPSFTFEEPGVYTATLIVTDEHGNKSEAQTEIKVGNAPPVVEIAFDGNQSFFYDNARLNYHITVKDKEDGSTRNGQINPAAVGVTFDYLKQSKDLALLGAGNPVSPYLKGRALIDGSDCKSCHAMDEKSIGPSYLQIAERYHGDNAAVKMLAQKVITGGNGNWGHSMMAAHPQLSEEETTEMIKYILSLVEAGGQAQYAIPLEGTLALSRHIGTGEEGTYFLSVSYTDHGGNDMPPISTRKLITLRHPRVQAEDYEEFHGVERQRPQGGAFAFISNIHDGSYIGFKNIDLTDITSLTYQVAAREGVGNISLRLGAPDGPEVSRVSVPASGNGRDFRAVEATITPTRGVHDVYFVFTHVEGKDDGLFTLDWIYFHTAGEEAL